MEFVPVMTLPSGELWVIPQAFLLTKDGRKGLDE